MSAYRDGDHAPARPDAAAAAETTLRSVRRALFLLLVVGLVGTALELVLMEHLDDWWQRIPLVLIAAALGVLLWHRFSRTRRSIYALRTVMILFLASAGGGVVLHAKGNREFALETKPNLAAPSSRRRRAASASAAIRPP